MEQFSADAIDIYNYTNVCQFLQDYYAYRKRIDPEFSYDTWAQELGAVNRSYLRLVVMGRRPVNENLQLSMEKIFNFSEDDRQYFVALVGWGRSRNKDEKKLWAQRIMSYQGISAEVIEAQAHYDFLSGSQLPALHTVMGFEDAPSDPVQLAEMFRVSLEEMKQKIAKLKELNLLENNRRANRSWKIAESIGSLGHQEFYRQTFQSAEEAMNLPKEQRRFRSLFVAMDEKEFEDFLSDFELFAQEQLAKRNSSRLARRRLYQLNFNFFAATDSRQENEALIKT